MLTRLELFIRRNNLGPVKFGRLAGYTRQHFFRIRTGESDATRGGILAVTGAARRVNRHQRVTPGMLFERADAFMKGTGQRLSVMHRADRRALDALLGDHVTAQFPERLRATGIVSETAVLHLLKAACDRIDSAPDETETICRAAAMMGEALPPDTPWELAQSLQGHASKWRANALRVLARFEDALACLTLSGGEVHPRRLLHGRSRPSRIHSRDYPF